MEYLPLLGILTTTYHLKKPSICHYRRILCLIVLGSFAGKLMFFLKISFEEAGDDVADDGLHKLSRVSALHPGWQDLPKSLGFHLHYPNEKEEYLSFNTALLIFSLFY